MKKLLLSVAAVLALVLAYLLLKPTPVDPVAWVPPVAPKLEGALAPNAKLAGIQRLAAGIGRGPEGLAIDAEGRLVTGFDDGRVIRLSADASRYEVLGNTGGRPLGVALAGDGAVLVADSRRGLVRVGADGAVRVLSTAAAGVPAGFPDDVDVDPASGRALYSDASAKFPDPYFLHDMLEHRPHGRVIAVDTARGESTVFADQLYFANGVAFGPGAESVFIAESGAYRIVRVWLKGPKAGQREVFVDNLPGFPDNVSFNGRDRIWVPLPSPRDATLDALAGWPLIRKMVARLPDSVQHALAFSPIKHAFVLGFDLDGRLVANLQHVSVDAFGPVTSVEEHGPWLYLGSLTQPSIARLPLSVAIEGVPPPPDGWQQAPERPLPSSP